MDTKGEVWKRKQDLMRNIMASSLSPATKNFAWAIVDFMYGDKTTAYPSTEALEKATGLSRSKFAAHRKALFEIGVMSGTKEKFKGRWENYTYELNLAWEPHREPSGYMDHEPSGSTDREPCGSTNTSKQYTEDKTPKNSGAVAPVDGEGTTSLPKSQKTTEVLVPPTFSNTCDGAVGVVTPTDRHEPSGYTVDTKALAATFGETREQTAARVAREEAAARIGGDW